VWLIPPRREVISFGRTRAITTRGTITFGPDSYMYFGRWRYDANDVGASREMVAMPKI
jgi:hypothetical protein